MCTTISYHSCIYIFQIYTSISLLDMCSGSIFMFFVHNHTITWYRSWPNLSAALVVARASHDVGINRYHNWFSSFIVRLKQIKTCTCITVNVMSDYNILKQTQRISRVPHHRVLRSLFFKCLAYTFSGLRYLSHISKCRGNIYLVKV